jgi:hypothetical protein
MKPSRSPTPLVSAQDFALFAGEDMVSMLAGSAVAGSPPFPARFMIQK